MKTDDIQLNPTLIQDIGLSPDDGSEILGHVMEVMSVLSKNDALTIFLMAIKDLKSELDTPTKIGLTKKQYYTRLKQLVDLGLLVKRGDSYTHTAFGKIIYQKHLLGITTSVKNSKYLEMVDTLKTNSKFSDADITDFLTKVNDHPSIDLEEPLVRNASLVSSFDEMASKALEAIEFAQHEIFMITRFQSEIIMNSILQKAKKGVLVKILADINLVNSYFMNESGVDKSDKNKKERINVVADPYYPSQVERRYVETPFSILIIDKKYVGIELVDSTDPGKFKMAVSIYDKALASSMTPFFEKMWKKSSQTVPKMISKST